MHTELEQYIRQKLSELDKQKDMQDVIHKGRLSFGMDKTAYGHLPAWDGLVQQRKKLVKLYWLSAYAVSLFIVLVVGDYFTKMSTSWLKASVQALLMSAVVMLFYVAVAYFNLFVRVRQTEREVRKLIYQDILFRLKTEKELV